MPQQLAPHKAVLSEQNGERIKHEVAKKGCSIRPTILTQRNWSPPPRKNPTFAVAGKPIKGGFEVKRTARFVPSLEASLSWSNERERKRFLNEESGREKEREFWWGR